ncbi:MAG: DNA polymerase III subunit delta [Myxococcota bacterium]|nr:DNA polymerase III subunit delta [Myxococcota bacterium]
MAFLSLIENLAPASLAPVYVLYGEERFFIDALLARIKEVALQGPMAAFNCVQLRAGDVSGHDIVSHAQEIPMMASRRVLIVSDGEKLTVDDWKALDPYLADPALTTCLVITATKLNKKRGPIARADKRGQLHQAEGIKQKEVGPFIRSRAKAKDVAIAPAAVSALAAAVGPDLGALDDAIERLGLYVGLGKKVTEAEVAEVITAVREHSIFELVDAIGSGRASQALTILEGLLSKREEPILINVMIARHFRLLLMARVHLHKGTSRSALPGLIGVPPFVVGKLLEQARRFRGVDLERALFRLSRTDLELKSSRRTPRLVVEHTVLDLCLNS